MQLPPRPVVPTKPRAPLAEKGQQMACMLATETFFRGEKTCSFRVSVKSLESPMKKDVLKIIDYLCNRLDAGMTEHFDLENQMTDFLDNQLVYPYEFPKTAFHIISNPNTYPHVLALISYLITENRKADEIKVAIRTADVSLVPTLQAYSAWLNGSADQEHKAIAHMFASEYSAIDQLKGDLSSVKVANTAIAAEVDELRNFANKISAATGQLDKLRTEEDQLNLVNARKAGELRKAQDSLAQLTAVKMDKAQMLATAKTKADSFVKTTPQLSRAKVVETRKQLETRKSEIDRLARTSTQTNSDLKTTTNTVRELEQKLNAEVAELNRKSQCPKIQFSAKEATLECVASEEPLLTLLTKKNSGQESETAELTRQIEKQKLEISRISLALQSAVQDEAESTRKLEKLKKDASQTDADRKTLEAKLNTVELECAKSSQKTKDLEISCQKLDAEIRKNFQALTEKLAVRKNEFAAATVPVETLRQKHDAEIEEKLKEVLRLKDAIDREVNAFNHSVGIFKTFGVAMPPLDVQWN